MFAIRSPFQGPEADRWLATASLLRAAKRRKALLQRRRRRAARWLAVRKEAADAKR